MAAQPPRSIHFEHPEPTTLAIHLLGSWTLAAGLPSAAEVQQQLDQATDLKRIVFDSQSLRDWDSALIAFLIRVIEQANAQGLEEDNSGLPEGVQRLLALAGAVPERQGARRIREREAVLTKVGKQVVERHRGALEMLAFIGEACLSLLKFASGRAQFRRSDLGLLLQSCGPQALGIVTLISFLVGLILAFMGSVQLQQFGAEIYTADLVALGMTREMGAMMTAIIMAGRTGAAFAAQLGTMRVNEEIDALTTLGVSPMEFLVLPRLLALVLMMPLLTLYSDLMGMLGGAAVGLGLLDLSASEYYYQTRRAIDLADLTVGLSKSVVYGVLVAIAGCLRGMQCGNSAAAVGDAATSAVVLSIVFVIVASATTTVMYNVLGI